MRFYTTQHKFHCGIDLHARYVRLHSRRRRRGPSGAPELPATPEHFLAAVRLHREDVVVAVECIFTWYWLADVCAAEGILFVLGHALYLVS
jgi:hypothetical protein